MVNLTVNGKPRPIDADVDLETYLESFGLNLQFVAVGYNGEVIKKEEYAGLKLKDGDVLESSALPAVDDRRLAFQPQISNYCRLSSFRL